MYHFVAFECLECSDSAHFMQQENDCMRVVACPMNENAGNRKHCQITRVWLLDVKTVSLMILLKCFVKLVVLYLFHQVSFCNHVSIVRTHQIPLYILIIGILAHDRKVLWETERPSVGFVNPNGEAERLGISSGSAPRSSIKFSKGFSAIMLKTE